MSFRFPLIVAVASGALLAGCAQGSLYNYGSYSQRLYDYQRDPTEREDYVEELQDIIAEGGEPGARQPVPPGIRAELGYMMLEAGNKQEAEALFSAEKQAWPEAGVFMDRMISVARGEAPRNFASTPEPQPLPVEAPLAPPSAPAESAPAADGAALSN